MAQPVGLVLLGLRASLVTRVMGLGPTYFLKKREKREREREKEEERKGGGWEGGKKDRREGGREARKKERKEKNP